MGAYDPVPDRASKLKFNDYCANCGNDTPKDVAFYDTTGRNICRNCFWNGNDVKVEKE
jgi:recombinational DNA repair protein (RecF pathway)